MKIQQSLWSVSARQIVGAGLIALTGLHAMAVDPDLPYASPSTGAQGALRFKAIPTSGRYATVIAYDAERQQTVLFGGYTPTPFNDTWVLDSNSEHWRNVSPVNSPPPRYGHFMEYDPVRKVVVLFGGYNNNVGALADTWIWNGTTWTQATPATSPSARYYGAMAFDAARGEMVLHGGNAPGSGGSETWTWNGTTWTLESPAATPGSQNGHGMAYDAVRQRVVMFTPSRQTWSWDGSNWANVSPINQPSNRDNFRLVWDAPRQQVLLYGGNVFNDTWLWNGTAWTQLSPATNPPGRNYYAITYDSIRQRVILYGGNVSGIDSYSSDTWFWDGTDWSLISAKSQLFDASADADGIFHYTTIDVPTGVTVAFKRNNANSPIRWLATGDVNIGGALNVSGEDGLNALPPGVVAKGGPGGFDGGRGAIRYDQSGSFAGTGGQGPGGGRAGANLNEAGNDGDYNGSNGYGNPFIQPLIGGSGGGGGGSTTTVNGGNGGGGGGAILIDSSRDIIISGAIYANGGNYQYSGASYGGRGSGGAILLRADRITGSGLLEAVGGQTRSLLNGRIRLEAFFRNFTGQMFPVAITSDPVQGPPLTQIPLLTITRIAAQNVPQPPTGNLLTPDVVFATASQAEITVTAQNVPDGTPVRLRLTTRDGVITAGPSFLNAGSASFNLAIPAGVGSVQAFADFRTGN